MIANPKFYWLMAVSGALLSMLACNNEVGKLNGGAGQLENLTAPLAGLTKPAQESALRAPLDSRCPDPYRETNPEWFPGLVRPPSTLPLFTDLPPSSPGVRYTDAGQDGWLAQAMAQANGMPAKMQKPSQDFAKQIRDVRVELHIPNIPINGQPPQAIVRFDYLMAAKKTPIELRGTLAKLTSAKFASGLSATLNCVDSDVNCQISILRIDGRNSAGEVVRSAFVVNRRGPAELTMSDEEEQRYARIRNQNHSAFAEFLSNTLNNSCRAQLVQGAAEHNLSRCLAQSLEARCRDDELKSPAAQIVELRSWSVAYGRAGFELRFGDIDHSGQNLTIQGPLEFSPVVPVGQRPLLWLSSGSAVAFGIQEVTLMNNDGGGQLNLRFTFASDQTGGRATNREESESLRLSVSTGLPGQ